MGTTDFSRPDSFSGTTAIENITGGATRGTGLGFVAEDSTPEINFGSVDGFVLADGGETLGAGTQFLFTFNGDFNSATAVPEPTSAALLGLGGVALFGRRRRS